MRAFLLRTSSLLLFTCAAVITGACGGGVTVPEGTPACVLDLAETMAAAPVENPPSSITEYEYNGEPVYYIPAACCDQASTVLDASCNVICAPDGGFTGQGDGKCPDFFDVAVKKQVIWKDDRT